MCIFGRISDRRTLVAFHAYQADYDILSMIYFANEDSYFEVDLSFCKKGDSCFDSNTQESSRDEQTMNPSPKHSIGLFSTLLLPSP